MALDASDFELLKSIRRIIRETGEATGAKIDRVHETERALLAAMEKSLQNDERIIAAFNRLAGATEALTEEIRGLRGDITPPVEKPKKLAPPRGLR